MQLVDKSNLIKLIITIFLSGMVGKPILLKLQIELTYTTHLIKENQHE